MSFSSCSIVGKPVSYCLFSIRYMSAQFYGCGVGANPDRSIEAWDLIAAQRPVQGKGEEGIFNH